MWRKENMNLQREDGNVVRIYGEKGIERKGM